MSPEAGFSMTLSYQNIVIEKRESFYSNSTNGTVAYEEWKKRKESGYPENNNFQLRDKNG